MFPAGHEIVNNFLELGVLRLGEKAARHWQSLGNKIPMKNSTFPDG